MFGLGMGELVLIFLIALIFIGPKKLPELAKGLGKGIRDFQNAAKGFSDQVQNPQETPQSENHEVVKIADTAQQTAANPSENPSPKNEDHHS
jgi:sec-independent protein translocase protein TatA